MATVAFMIFLWFMHAWIVSDLRHRNEHLKQRNRKLTNQNHDLVIRMDGMKFRAKDCFFCDPDRERMLP